MEPVLPDPGLGNDLQRDVHVRTRGVVQHDPVVLRLFTRNIAERVPPEREHAVEVVAVDDDPSNPNTTHARAPSDER
jgi:hypothetical protein